MAVPPRPLTLTLQHQDRRKRLDPAGAAGQKTVSAYDNQFNICHMSELDTKLLCGCMRTTITAVVRSSRSRCSESEAPKLGLWKKLAPQSAISASSISEPNESGKDLGNLWGFTRFVQLFCPPFCHLVEKCKRLRNSVFQPSSGLLQLPSGKQRRGGEGLRPDFRKRLRFLVLMRNLPMLCHKKNRQMIEAFLKNRKRLRFTSSRCCCH